VANAYHDPARGRSESVRAVSSGPPGLFPPPAIPIARLRAAVQVERSSKSLSINDLMMRSGLSRTAILDLLNGRGRIACGRLDTWWALAWALDMPIGTLMSSLDDQSSIDNVKPECSSKEEATRSSA